MIMTDIIMGAIRETVSIHIPDIAMIGGVMIVTTTITIISAASIRMEPVITMEM